MIGQIRGKLSYASDKFAIVEASGVGYKLFLISDSLKELSGKLGEEVLLWTHLVVREDVLDLYGFFARSELDFFELLIGVSGVGPKSALAILSLAPPETLAQAVATNNLAYLTQVSGIGRKMAEKIILELRDKLLTMKLGEESNLEEESEAMLALEALGYSARDAREALRKLPPEITNTSEKIKLALKQLGDKRR